jgi:hypothetical protein
MMNAVESANMNGLYSFHSNIGGLIVSITNVALSSNDNDFRAEALVVIRFILVMYDKRSMVMLIAKLIGEFDKIPSVAALFIDVIKDMIQCTQIHANWDLVISNDLKIDAMKHEPFSFPLIYKYFVLKVLKQIQLVSCSDDTDWISIHADVVSATITLLHTIVLRLKFPQTISGNDSNVIQELIDMTTKTQHAMTVMITRNYNLKFDLMCFELDGILHSLKSYDGNKLQVI